MSWNEWDGGSWMKITCEYMHIASANTRIFNFYLHLTELNFCCWQSFNLKFTVSGQYGSFHSDYFLDMTKIANPFVFLTAGN